MDSPVKESCRRRITCADHNRASVLPPCQTIRDPAATGPAPVVLETDHATVFIKNVPVSPFAVELQGPPLYSGGSTPVETQACTLGLDFSLGYPRLRSSKEDCRGIVPLSCGSSFLPSIRRSSSDLLGKEGGDALALHGRASPCHKNRFFFRSHQRVVVERGVVHGANDARESMRPRSSPEQTAGTTTSTRRLWGGTRPYTLASICGAGIFIQNGREHFRGRSG